MHSSCKYLADFNLVLSLLEIKVYFFFKKKGFTNIAGTIWNPFTDFKFCTKRVGGGLSFFKHKITKVISLLCQEKGADGSAQELLNYLGVSFMAWQQRCVQLIPSPSEEPWPVQTFSPAYRIGSSCTWEWALGDSDFWVKQKSKGLRVLFFGWVWKMVRFGFAKCHSVLHLCNHPTWKANLCVCLGVSWNVLGEEMKPTTWAQTLGLGGEMDQTRVSGYFGTVGDCEGIT